ncbi:MAG: DNA polymerase IV [Deltaproteobacteria bacterium]|jgi:DNA polymerase-4|nr:DNA polymerase IV [Deltaproteobacteria bacterium]
MAEVTRWIIHLDMDAFYASVEILDNPSLKGLPVIVGGLGDRGVVSTASYAARAKGVRSAMPIVQARRLCPEGIYLWPKMARYQELSAKVMDIFQRYTPLVEPLSLDEAFLDVTGSLKLFGSAPEIAARVKKEVLAETGLTVSAGVATQKHIAKIASGFQKPDGLTVIQAGGEKDFLWPLPLSRLWGVGPATLKTLESLGLKIIGDLAKTPAKAMEAKLGNSGLKLWLLANCEDEREVEPDRIVKSIGHEETYAIDIDGEEAINRELLALSVKVAKRLRANQLKGRTLTLKIRSQNFKTFTRSRTLSLGLDVHLDIYRLAKELFPWEKKGPYRLLGISASNFVAEGDLEYPQEDLFGPPKPAPNARLAKALDKINDRFGEAGLKPASLLDKPRRKN